MKPSNVLVNSSGSIKLCDFGVSRVFETIGQKVATFVGTHKYMAPERVSSDEYSIPSEIWSLGMTILEIGLGKYPFHQDQPGTVRPIELVQKILYGTPPLLPTTRGYSPEFASLMQRCLSKNSADRPLPMHFFENPLLLKYSNNDVNQNRAIIAEFFNRTATS